MNHILKMLHIPAPLIRLISGYLFYFKSGDAIAELLDYNETKAMTPNIVFYYVIDNATINYVSVSNFANFNMFNLLIALLDTYDESKFNIMSWLGEHMSWGTEKQSYPHKYIYSSSQTMDLNMIDAIIIQCAKKKNKRFLDDFISEFKIISDDQFCRCDGEGIRFPYKYRYPRNMSLRDILDFFALEDDVECLIFVLQIFGSYILHYVRDKCHNYVIDHDLPKLKQFRLEYLALNGQN